MIENVRKNWSNYFQIYEFIIFLGEYLQPNHYICGSSYFLKMMDFKNFFLIFVILWMVFIVNNFFYSIKIENLGNQKIQDYR